MMAVCPNEQKTESNGLMKIEELINERTVFFLDQHHKTDVLDVLTHNAAELGLAPDLSALRAAIDARETLSSTAIGDEIAIPHAKLPGLERFFVMTAVLNPAVEWDAPDQKPVKLVFLIAGPQDDPSGYLKLLCRILRSVKSVDKKELILAAKNCSEIAAILTQ